MNLVSATQLELMIPRLPNVSETSRLWWNLRKAYDQSEVRFHNTSKGWGLIVHGNMILVEYVEAMIRSLPSPDEVNADSYRISMPSPREFNLTAQTVPLDERVLCWEKSIFDDASGNPIVEWSIPIN